MARIRQFKLGYFLNENLARTSCHARLTGLGLLLIADREGRIEDRPMRIKAEVFPYEDNLNMTALLDELVGAGFICRYTIDGGNYLAIKTFAKHQRPHPREAVSVIPVPPDPINLAVPRKEAAGPWKEMAEPSKETAESGKETAEPVRNGILDPGSLGSGSGNGNGNGGKTDPARKGAHSPDPPEFESFYAAYPRKKARADALKAWTSVVRPEDLPLIEQALAWQRLQPDWTKEGRKYVPYPAKYLREKRWLDEPPTDSDPLSANDDVWKALDARTRRPS
jgi:hypothetical protein